jgi:hypothetical protein
MTANLDVTIRTLAAASVKASGKSRAQIADEMSAHLGTAISEHMLFDVTAESKVNHRFPLLWVPAFCKATGDWRLLHAIAEECSFLLLSQKEADVLALGEECVAQKRAERHVNTLAIGILERRSSR